MEAVKHPLPGRHSTKTRVRARSVLTARGAPKIQDPTGIGLGTAACFSGAARRRSRRAVLRRRSEAEPSCSPMDLGSRILRAAGHPRRPLSLAAATSTSPPRVEIPTAHRLPQVPGTRQVPLGCRASRSKSSALGMSGPECLLPWITHASGPREALQPKGLSPSDYQRTGDLSTGSTPGGVGPATRARRPRATTAAERRPAGPGVTWAGGGGGGYLATLPRPRKPPTCRVIPMPGRGRPCSAFCRRGPGW
jgi:hypothetical protein